ncbi:MAG: hypothetical protein DYG98_18355 [Haliscomenobacteraceae bacterium CHB4]|nr:hypothetical protein [Haliscomenobacteraceae bacterium CHB4]
MKTLFFIRILTVFGLIIGSLSIYYQFKFLDTLLNLQPEYEGFLLAVAIAMITLFISRYCAKLKSDYSDETGVNNQNILYPNHVDTWEAIVIGVMLTGTIYLILFSFDSTANPFIASVIEKLAQRGSIPILTLTFFSVAIIICLFKLFQTLRTWNQFNIINKQLLFKQPDSLENKSSRRTSFIERRIEYGRTADSNEGPEYFAELDREELGSSYTFAQFLLWSIPVLGFIGTVWGIGQSIEGFTFALGQSGTEGLSSELLRPSLGYLAVAFDTTLVALTLGIIAMLAVTFMQKTEDRLLTKCHLLFAKKSLYNNNNFEKSNTDLFMPESVGETEGGKTNQTIMGNSQLEE